MIRRPRIKSQWIAQQCDSGQFLLSSEDDLRLLTGPRLDRLLPLLDGTRTIQQLIHFLDGVVSAKGILGTIKVLADQGLVADGTSDHPKEDAFWDLLGTDCQAVRSRQNGATVEVVNIGVAEAESLIHALSAMRIAVTPDASFRIVVTDDYLDPSLAKINSDAIARGIPWMLVRPFGRRQWLGPLLIPGRTPCWKCFAERLRVNGCTAALSRAVFPVASAVVQAIAAIEAAKWLLLGKNPELEAQIRVFDTGALNLVTHAVAYRPQCSVCRSTKKSRGRYTKSGNPPTLLLHDSPITGIFFDLRQIHAEPGFYVWSARLSQKLHRDHMATYRITEGTLVVGKGQDPDETRQACMAEAAERYSVQFHGEESRVSATLEQLGNQAVGPDQLMLFSDLQYRRRKLGSWISERLGPDESIEWVLASSLTTGARCYVPAAYCHIGYGSTFCSADTNGCAAGQQLMGAILQGFLELVERDAVALWWYNRVQRPEVDLSTFSGVRISAMRDFLSRAKCEFHVLDITTDFAIPTFAAVSLQNCANSLLLGTGSALDPETSVWRALLELGVRVLNPRKGRRSRLNEHEYLVPSPDREWRSPAISPVVSGTIAEQVGWCTQAAKRVGVEILVVDMTRPELGFPVARIIAPGMRPWSPRLAAGRLYDTPVQLGWRKRAMCEQDANPVPVII